MKPKINRNMMFPAFLALALLLIGSACDGNSITIIEDGDTIDQDKASEKDLDLEEQVETETLQEEETPVTDGDTSEIPAEVESELPGEIESSEAEEIPELCANAIALRCGDSFAHSTSEQGRADVWNAYNLTQRAENGRETLYTFTADSDSRVSLELKDLQTDLDLMVLNTCDSFDCLTVSSTPDDIRNSETILFNAQAGRTYFVVVDGYAAASGTYTLSASCESGTIDGDTELDSPTENEAESDSEPGVDDPYKNGPLGFTRTTLKITVQGSEESQNRDINVEVFVPKNATGKPFPLVILNHGFQSSGTAYLGFGQRLASHGFVTLLPSWGDNAIFALTHRALAAYTIGLIEWALKENHASVSVLREMIDPDHIGVGGHSRGGKQSLLAATQDERIIASFNLDPVDSSSPTGGTETEFPSVTPEKMGDLHIPLGFIGAGHGGEGLVACAPEDQNYHQYFISALSPAFEYNVLDAGHMDFMDNCGALCATCPSSDGDAWIYNFANATQLAFYKVYLAGDQRYQPWVEGDPVTSLNAKVKFHKK